MYPVKKKIKGRLIQVGNSLDFYPENGGPAVPINVLMSTYVGKEIEINCPQGTLK